MTPEAGPARLRHADTSLAQRVPHDQLLERDPPPNCSALAHKPADGARMRLQHPRALVVITKFRVNRSVPQPERAHARPPSSRAAPTAPSGWRDGVT